MHTYQPIARLKKLIIFIGTDRYVASVSLARSDLQDGTPLFTVAFFYCLVDFRNRSFGKYLFDKIQSIYGDHNCFLFGVGTMWQWYEKRYGFKELSPYFHCSAVIQIENLKIPSGIKEVDGVTVEDLKYDSVSEYDKGICKMSRTKVINTWLMACGVHSKVCIPFFNSSNVLILDGCRFKRQLCGFRSYP